MQDPKTDNDTNGIYETRTEDLGIQNDERDSDTGGDISTKGGER